MKTIFSRNRLILSVVLIISSQYLTAQDGTTAFTFSIIVVLSDDVGFENAKSLLENGDTPLSLAEEVHYLIPNCQDI